MSQTVPVPSPGTGRLHGRPQGQHLSKVSMKMAFCLWSPVWETFPSPSPLFPTLLFGEREEPCLSVCLPVAFGNEEGGEWRQPGSGKQGSLSTCVLSPSGFSPRPCWKEGAPAPPEHILEASMSTRVAWGVDLKRNLECKKQRFTQVGAHESSNPSVSQDTDRTSVVRGHAGPGILFWWWSREEVLPCYPFYRGRN